MKLSYEEPFPRFQNLFISLRRDVFQMRDLDSNKNEVVERLPVIVEHLKLNQGIGYS